MATHVIGAFDDAETARKVIDQLVEAGCPEEEIDILDEERDEVAGELVDRGFDEEQARTYAAALGRGKTLVAARAPDEKADAAVAIMDRHESSDIGGGERSQQQEGRRTRGRQETVQEVEEELSVGKRKVSQGGVRVTTNVTERPVEEIVRLREEEVEVGRRKVDRELRPEEAEAAFEEQTVEMTETGEEAEVRKEARVKGEVSLGKKVEEHEQTVRDTVRRAEVEVEKLEPAARKRK
jgi:stress response protein YsnF